MAFCNEIGAEHGLDPNTCWVQPACPWKVLGPGLCYSASFSAHTKVHSTTNEWTMVNFFVTQLLFQVLTPSHSHRILPSWPKTSTVPPSAFLPSQHPSVPSAYDEILSWIPCTNLARVKLLQPWLTSGNYSSYGCLHTVARSLDGQLRPGWSRRLTTASPEWSIELQWYQICWGGKNCITRLDYQTVCLHAYVLKLYILNFEETIPHRGYSVLCVATHQ